MLTAVKHKVCVVTGAAGWGKTTAVRQACASRCVSWVSHEDHDGDPDRLLKWISAALDMDGFQLLGANREERGLGDAVRIGLRDVPRRAEATLIIDDVQDLPTTGPAATLLRDLCLYAHPWLHMVLISRQPLPFSIKRLGGRGLAAEIDTNQLGLTAEEVGVLLRHSVGVDQPDLTALVLEATDGWPAAVAHLLGRLSDTPQEQRIDAVRRYVWQGERFHRYVAEQVLGGESRAVLELLRKMAVCEETDRLPSDLIGLDSEPAELEGRGLVRRCEAEVGRWRLIAPLRAYFERELLCSPGHRARLHSDVSAYYAARGSYTEALRHALAAGDESVCRELLTKHGTALVRSGDAEAVRQVAHVPAEWASVSAINEVVGEARQVLGQWAGALASFRRAGAENAKLEPSLAWRMGMLAYVRAEFGEVLSIFKRTCLTREGTADEAQILSLAAIANRMIGKYSAGRELVSRAMSAADRARDSSALAAAYISASMFASVDGDLRKARAYRAGALDAAEAAGDVLLQLQMHVVSVGHWLELRRPRRALSEAETAVSLGLRCGDACMTAHALTIRGHVRLRIGQPDAARRDFAHAAESFESLGSGFLAWPVCGLGDVHRLRGQRSRAQASYEEALALAEQGQDVLGIGAALIGLARVRAANDPAAARNCADRAVNLGEQLCRVQALVTRGWVALSDGDKEAAAADAVRAAALARSRADEPGMAEALSLEVLSSEFPARELRRLGEAIDVWRETGCVLEESAARVVVSRLKKSTLDTSVSSDVRRLRTCGVDLRDRRVAGPLAASLTRLPSVSVKTLGIFQVLHSGVPVPTTAWQSRKARDLVKILIAYRRPVSREQLMELLWPDVPPCKSGNRLSVLLSTVRDVLQPAHPQNGCPLISDGTAVWLDRSLIDIDVENFLAEAAAALAAHRDNMDGRLSFLFAAEQAYTGGFLDDDPYREWAGPLTEEVRATYAAVLRALAANLRATTDADGATRYLLRLLELDRYDERAHIDLVELLQLAGQFGTARRRYRIYASCMADIGVAPRPYPSGRDTISWET